MQLCTKVNMVFRWLEISASSSLHVRLDLQYKKIHTTLSIQPQLSRLYLVISIILALRVLRSVGIPKTCILECTHKSRTAHHLPSTDNFELM